MEVSDAYFQLAFKFVRRHYRDCDGEPDEEWWQMIGRIALRAARCEDTSEISLARLGAVKRMEIANYLFMALYDRTTRDLLRFVDEASKEVKLHLLVRDDDKGLTTEIFHTDAELQARRVEIVEDWEKGNEDDEPVAPRLKQAFADGNADLAADLWEQFAKDTAYNNNYYNWDEQTIKVDLFK